MEMFMYISVFIIYALCGYLYYLHKQIDRKLKEQTETSKKALIEAGNALTETLRIAFDNLKRQGMKLDKTANKDTEYQSRFHRIEQNIQRILSNMDNAAADEKKEIKNERRNNKTS